MACLQIIVMNGVNNITSQMNEIRVPKSSLPNDLNKFFEMQQFTDVTFLVDGRDLKAHKCILTGNCYYYKFY